MNPISKASPPISVFFFSLWTSKKYPWTISRKCPWTFCICPWTFKKILPVNPKSAREQPKKCPFAREHFQKKVSVNLWKLPVNIKILCFFVTFFEKVSVNCEKCPWTFPKKCPWTHPKVPVKTSKKVPVNTPSNPWTFTKKCPWTQKSTREHRPKNGVHGHFWCSRGKKHCCVRSTSGCYVIGDNNQWMHCLTSSIFLLPTVGHILWTSWYWFCMSEEYKKQHYYLASLSGIYMFWDSQWRTLDHKLTIVPLPTSKSVLWVFCLLFSITGGSTGS